MNHGRVANQVAFITVPALAEQPVFQALIERHDGAAGAVAGLLVRGDIPI
jgi:hypothetical protein